MKVQISDIVVVGGGPAGMMAAIKAAEKGCSVTLLEKNSSCGKKILITGKGRCNLTNTKSWQEFATHLHPVAAFLKPAFFNFSNKATVDFFNSIGLPTVVEQGGRVFPESMKAADVSKILVSRLLELGVDIICNAEVKNISEVDGNLKCTYISSQIISEGEMKVRNTYSSAVVVATGGLSYPSTGSTGAGYEIAKSFSHTIVDTFPSLTALIPDEYDSKLHGINLANVGVNLFVNNDIVQMEMGEINFTSNGIEGALGFRVSRKAIVALRNDQRVELVLDLKPALSLETLRERIKRDMVELKIPKNREISTRSLKILLKGLMPSALITPFLNQANGLTIDNLPYKLKDWRFKITSYIGYERAVVTAGGVSQKEIIAKYMRSRLNPNLYFAGEVIDIDGDTGGYNLQIAFSTGALAGECAAQQILKSKSV